MQIDLTQQEALVLFDFLYRNNKDNCFAPLIEDQAEERVLWNLECILEKELSEPFAENYKEMLNQARLDVRGKD